MRIKIAYLTHEDPNDKKSWSGIHKCMLEALTKQKFQVVSLGPVKLPQKRVLKLFEVVIRKIIHKRFRPSHSILLSKIYAKIFKEKIERENPDLIFAANASTEIAFLNNIDIPVIYLSGGTFELLENYHKAFSNLFRFSSKHGNLIERNAINKAAAIIYPTFWAANSAINDYGAPDDKVHVIPYGANVSFNKSVYETKRLDKDHVRLLLVGVQWESKGIPIAIETVRVLREKGLTATLDICGCHPPKPVKETGVKIHGFLDKRKPDEEIKLKKLYREANFFILPTRHENFGVSFVEAFAAGLPCLGTNTGGVPTIIENGKNGYLFELSDRGEAYASKIETLVNDEKLYQDMSVNARKSYEKRFNWKIWSEEVSKVIHSLTDKY